MSDYEVLLSESVREFLSVADEKTERICKDHLRQLADNPHPGRGRGDKEPLPIDGRRDRFRMHISRTYTAIYTIIEERDEVRVLEVVPIDEAHKRYGF